MQEYLDAEVVPITDLEELPGSAYACSVQGFKCHQYMRAVSDALAKFCVHLSSLIFKSVVCTGCM